MDAELEKLWEKKREADAALDKRSREIGIIHLLEAVAEIKSWRAEVVNGGGVSIRGRTEVQDAYNAPHNNLRLSMGSGTLWIDTDIENFGEALSLISGDVRLDHESEKHFKRLAQNLADFETAKTMIGKHNLKQRGLEAM